MKATDTQDECFIPPQMESNKVRIEQVETREAQDHDEISYYTPHWPVPIACNEIKEPGEEIRSKLPLSAKHNALKSLRMVGEACCLLMQSLCLQSNSQLTVRSNRCLIFI